MIFDSLVFYNKSKAKRLKIQRELLRIAVQVLDVRSAKEKYEKTDETEMCTSSPVTKHSWSSFIKTLFY